ncbi:MAG: class I SAM-dependent methyltransferase [Rickettsiales bacterium]|jgi:2-polyprenyl-3-methyl-5-hydroxy-6-metoxy-1,4-benzoquinol methylase|nr:class I SAM-dependent methyltransferase [Rickettsiales bacterium]
MKNSDFNYSYYYSNWHSDTLESRQNDINCAKCLFDLHTLYPLEKSDRVLEIGCGMGRYMLMLREAGYENLTGVDIDISQINVAKKENLSVHMADATEFLVKSSEKYSVIYAFDILEHIDKEKQLSMLKAMFGATTGDGFVAFSVPNGLAPLASFYRYADFTHTVSYTDITMRFLLHNAGFHHTAVRPQHQESEEVQRLKLPWAQLYRNEFGLEDFILTPNLIVAAFKTQNALDRYLANVPVIRNDYSKKKLCGFGRLWEYIKSGKF